MLEPGDLGATPIDFSKATKLKKMVFRFEEYSVLWVTMALRTITPEHEDLHGISIHLTSHSSSLSTFESPLRVRQLLGVNTYMKWMDLDRVLVQLCEPRAVCVEVRSLSAREDEAREHVEDLLPGATKRGMIRLVGNADL
jgi:hypothetical protein